MTIRWHITELVAWGLKSCRQTAEERSRPYIFVEEIYLGSTRISAQIGEHGSVVRFMADNARLRGRAFLILKRTEHGWIADDFGNVVGNRIDVNRMYQTGYSPVVARPQIAAQMREARHG